MVAKHSLSGYGSDRPIVLSLFEYEGGGGANCISSIALLSSRRKRKLSRRSEKPKHNHVSVEEEATIGDPMVAYPK